MHNFAFRTAQHPWPSSHTPQSPPKPTKKSNPYRPSHQASEHLGEASGNTPIQPVHAAPPSSTKQTTASASHAPAHRVVSQAQPFPPSKFRFTHVPIPNRSESATYDPDRYLYQQSAAYLRYNHDTLTTITAYATQHPLPPTPKKQKHQPPPQRRPLKARLDTAQFLIIRFTYALEIQRLEDQAIHAEIRCCGSSSSSSSSADDDQLGDSMGRGDGFSDDWLTYSVLARAVEGRVGRNYARLVDGAFRSKLVRIDYKKVLEGGWG